MPNDNEQQRSERLASSQAHIAHARKITKESRLLREASKRLLAGKRPRHMR